MMISGSEGSSSFGNLPMGINASESSSKSTFDGLEDKSEPDNCEHQVNDLEKDGSDDLLTNADEIQDNTMIVSTFRCGPSTKDLPDDVVEQSIDVEPKNHEAWGGSEKQCEVDDVQNSNTLEENKSEKIEIIDDFILVSDFERVISSYSLQVDVIAADQSNTADHSIDMGSLFTSESMKDNIEGRQSIASNSVCREMAPPDEVSPSSSDHYVINDEMKNTADMKSTVSIDGRLDEDMPHNEESIIISCPSVQERESPLATSDDIGSSMKDDESGLIQPIDNVLLGDATAPPYMGEDWETLDSTINIEALTNTSMMGRSSDRKSSLSAIIPPTVTTVVTMSRGNSTLVTMGDNEVKAGAEWCPPSIAEAVNFKKRAVFREGVSSLWRANVTRATDLSIGVVLYFEFAKAACHCMFILTILSVPAIVISYSGSRIPQSERDILGFSQYTIGNIGHDPKSSTYARDSACKNESSTYNGTCINVLGREVKFSDAQSILTVCEMLQIMVFFLFIFHLNYIKKMHMKYARQDECKIEDYTIMCRRLPKDTTMEELTKHFNLLYPLDVQDWYKREPIRRARVVQCSENSGNDFFIGLWIADCVLFHAIGKGISAFKLHQNWTINLLRSRALVSMYSDGTCHKNGPNIIKRNKAEKKLKKVIKKIEILSEDLDYERKKYGEYTIDKKSGYRVVTPIPVVAGFLTFEYCESLKRCVDDYTYYNSFPRNLFFYPNRLLFKGKRIKVEKAPDPGEVIWEHLEVPGFSKRYRRFITFLISFFLLIISFIAILQASIYKNIFSMRISTGPLCTKHIPLLFGAYNNITSVENFKFVRPINDNDIDNKFILDEKCNSIISNSFYAVYSIKNDINQPIANYDFSACNSSITSSSHYYHPSQSELTPIQPGGTCPNFGQKTFCPCISKKSTSSCHTSSCSVKKETLNCVSYSASTLHSCYCQQSLNSYLEKGVISTLQYLSSISSTQTADSCSSFFSDYSTAQVISYGTILVSIGVNAIVLILMKKLSNYESHVSVDREDGTLMMKVFIFSYFNMAFSVLIAFGKISNMPNWLKTAYIFQGQYTDFSSEWYTNTGVYFLSAYLIKSIVDIIIKLMKFTIINPIKRYRNDEDIRNNSSEEIVTQYELNEMHVGPLFPSSENNAHFLTMLFFAMTYASGLPLLMPMAFVTLSVLFHVDRLLLLRFNRKPPHMGDGIMNIIIRILPYAAIIRLCIACWMFGYSEIFDGNITNSIYSDNYKSWLTDKKNEYDVWFSSNHLGEEKYDRTLFIVERVFRPNVFPLLLLLIFIISIAVIQIFWKLLPFFWIGKFLNLCDINFIKYKRWNYGVRNKIHVTTIDMSYRKSDVRVLRINNQPMRHSAPFTGEYFCHLPRSSIHFKLISKYYFRSCCMFNSRVDDVSREKKIHYMNQEEDGWVFIDSVDIEGKNSILGERGCAYKLKKWTYNSHNGGNIRNIGDPKMTYEVIQDSGCSSYSLEKIPGYMLAVKGLKEGNNLLNNIRFQRRNTLTEKGNEYDFF